MPYVLRFGPNVLYNSSATLGPTLAPTHRVLFLPVASVFGALMPRGVLLLINANLPQVTSLTLPFGERTGN